MATTKAEFQDLAAELIDDEFADFRRSLVLTNLGSYDPGTGTQPVSATMNTLAIRTALRNSQYQNQLIQVGDFNCAYNRAGETLVPSATTQAVYDGVKCQIIDVMLDGADATVKLVLRAK